MSITSPERAARCVKTALDSVPTDFDASAHPIIARHWLGIEPFRQKGQVAAETVAGMKFRRRVERLHKLGPRAVGEHLAELAAERSIGIIIDRKLATYTELQPAALKATGGDEFWAVPLREVRP